MGLKKDNLSSLEHIESLHTLSKQKAQAIVWAKVPEPECMKRKKKKENKPPPQKKQSCLCFGMLMAGSDIGKNSTNPQDSL